MLKNLDLLNKANEKNNKESAIEALSVTKLNIEKKYDKKNINAYNCGTLKQYLAAYITELIEINAMKKKKNSIGKLRIVLNT